MFAATKSHRETARSRSVIPVPMLRHAWFLILCLLASSLVATATLHSRESDGFAPMSCSGAVHVDGDADQVPADGDQGVPHHHASCHGHNLTAPVASPALLAMTTARDAPSAAAMSRLARRTVDPALRPPRA